MNLFTFYFMAPSVLTMLGTRSFLALYLGGRRLSRALWSHIDYASTGGLVSSLTSLWFNNVFRPSQKNNYSSHGASGTVSAINSGQLRSFNSLCHIAGAIYSIVSFFACVAPRAQFALFGIIPMPAWLVVTGVFLIDGYSALNNKVCRFSFSYHIYLDPRHLPASRRRHGGTHRRTSRWHRLLPLQAVPNLLINACTISNH